MKRLQSPRRRGFTLVEMLVTLAIMAMVSALLWQAMHHIMRVERLLQNAGVDGQLQVVRREWLRGLIQASLVEQKGKPLQFQGEVQRMTVASAEALNLPGLSGNRLEILLETEPRSGRQRLMLNEMPATETGFASTGTGTFAVELLSWEGEPGRLQFMDGTGHWIDQWPPPLPVVTDPFGDPGPAGLQLLPRAVCLNLGAEAGGPLIVDVSVTEPGRMNRVQWERQ